MSRSLSMEQQVGILSSLSRALRLSIVLSAATLGACAHAPPIPDGPLLELSLDEGKPDQQPVITGKLFETLLRFDPGGPGLRMHQLRFLLASPGTVHFTFYAADGNRPGREVYSVEHVYDPILCGSARGERWVLENLDDAPPIDGAFYVGVSSDTAHSDARIWAASNRSPAVSAREADGTFSPIKRTIVVRVVLVAR